MRTRFETIYRSILLILFLTLAWSVWAAAPPPPAVPLPVIVSTNAEWLTFGLENVEAFQTEFFGQPVWRLLASLTYIILAFLISKFLDYIITGRLKKWAEKTETKFDDLLLELVSGPVKVISFVILLHIGLRIFVWPAWIEDFLSKGLYIIVAISLTYVAVKFVDLLVLEWSNRAAAEHDRSFDHQLAPILRKSLKTFVLVVSVLVTSQNLGLNITGVLASLSIGGLALGLAAQDTLANMFGAVAIFVDKPFRIGDRIRLDQVDGTVETIGMRSTRVRNLDGYLVTIPNKTMGNATITNISRRPNIKTEMNIGITYDTPAAKVQRALAILEEIYRAHPKTAEIIISFNRFADSSLNILVSHLWAGTDMKEYLQGMQDLNLAVKKRFDEEAIEFAFPTQTHYVKHTTVGPQPPKSA